MKRVILNTPLGRLAVAVRDSVAAFRAAYSYPETAGTLANDHLARVLVSRLCRPNRTFLDIGAHIGSIVSEVSYRYPSVRIIAFEPIPDKVSFLRRKFPQVELHGCALSDSEGEASFFVNRHESGYSSLGLPTTNEDEFVATKVPVRRLDEVVTTEDVDVIKIDVEGAELGVLRGGERLITASRATIMFESGPQANDGLGYTKEELWEWISDHGYAVLIPNRLAHHDPGLDMSGFLESHLYPRRTTNYFAVARERRDELRTRARDVLNMRAV